MAQLFGAGYSYDAFLLGFRIPNLTRDLFAEGALSSAFVPIFTGYLQKEQKKEASRLSNQVASAIVVFVGGFVLLGIVFSPQLVWLLAPGFSHVPGKFGLAVHLTRIMFPFLVFVALAAQMMGILNACNQFGVPAMASTFFNVSSVLLGLALGFYVGPYVGVPPIVGMAYGVVLGGAAQLFWQLPSLRRSGFGFHFDFSWNHPGLRQILRLMLPAIVGNAAVQINVMVNTNFASRLADPIRGPDGPVSWLAYAFRFMQLPLGLFGVSFASAILPSISRSVAAGDYEEFRKTLAHSLGLVFLLTIPSTVGLVLLGRPIIGAIFQGGRFELYDTEQTAVALSCYAAGLAGYAATKVLNPAFYALSDARTPMRISIVSVLVNIGTAEVLIEGFHMGISALALSTSAVATLACFVLFAIIRSRLGGIEGRYLSYRLMRTGAASAIMAVPVWITCRFVADHFGTSRAADLLNLAVSIPIGLGVFFAAAMVLRIGEIRVASAALTRPILRKVFGYRAGTYDK